MKNKTKEIEEIVAEIKKNTEKIAQLKRFDELMYLLDTSQMLLNYCFSEQISIKQKGKGALHGFEVIAGGAANDDSGGR